MKKRGLCFLAAFVISVSAFTGCGGGVTPGGETWQQSYVSLVGYGDVELLWLVSENQENREDGRHCPVVRIDSAEELEEFITLAGEQFYLDYKVHDVYYTPFAEVCSERFNEEFFLTQSVLVVGVIGKSSSFTYSLRDVELNDTLTIILKENSPAVASADLSGVFVTVVMNKQTLSSVNKIDARI